MFFLFFSLFFAPALSADCGDHFCTSGFRDQHLNHLRETLNVLRDPIEATTDLTAELNQYTQLIQHVINATTVSTKGYIQPAEPFFWLQRQLNLMSLVQKAERTAQIIKSQANLYMEQVNQYLYNVYNLHPSRSTGCYLQNNAECTKTAAIDAGKALLRLQETYLLSEDAVTVLSKASKTQENNLTISAADCYELGKLAFEEGEWERSLQWINIAFQKAADSKKQPFSLAELYDYISYAEYKLGHFQEAIDAAEKYLKIDPTSERLRDNIKFYSEELKNSQPQTPPAKPYIAKEYVSYKKLCRALLEDENDQSVVLDDTDTHGPAPKKFSVSPLWEYVDPLADKCFFIDPKIGGWDSYRVGVEAVSMVPPVIVFHNFLTDWECEQLAAITHSTGELRRSTVVDPESGQLINAPYRSSQSVFLRRAEHKIVAEIEDRVQHLTQLDLELGDRLQISHYAPGGHYGPHHDFGVDPREKNKPEGNRIATVLMYFNHVMAGGATAFMSADPPFAVRPRKGDAVFWYNLGGPHPNPVYHESDEEKGESQPSDQVLKLNAQSFLNDTDWYKAPDFRGENGLRDTRHAACPVQAGLKWVANYWVREYPKNSHRYSYFYAPNRPLTKK